MSVNPYRRLLRYLALSTSSAPWGLACTLWLITAVRLPVLTTTYTPFCNCSDHSGC